MADTPFMQFYGSDFVGDTLHLTAEQIGAYMLLLIAMWNAKGKLPNDPKKLARVARMSPSRWDRHSSDLLPFFEQDEEAIWHKRMQKNIKNVEQKRATNRVNGSKGGAAKALKDKEAGLANATNSPQRKASIARATPEPELDSEEKKPSVSKRRASRLAPDWAPTPEDDDWLREKWPGVTRAIVNDQLERFRNYWISKSGKDATKLDWSRTWRNWMLTEKARAGGPARSQPQRKQSAAELASEVLSQMEAADERNAQAEGNHPPATQHAIAGPLGRKG